MAASTSSGSCTTGEVTFSVSVNLINEKDNSNTCIVKNAIRKFATDYTWFDVFDISTESADIPQDVIDDFEKNAKVNVQRSTGTETFDANPYDKISILTDFDRSLRYVTINVKSTLVSGDASVSTDTCNTNVFNVLMGNRTKKTAPPKLSEEKTRFTAKDRLYNDLIDDAKEIEFPVVLPKDEMTRRLMVIVDALWYIDGNQEKINNRLEANQTIPQRFSKYSGYNDYKKKRKAAPQLSSPELKRHASLLYGLSSSTHAVSWGDFTKELDSLALSLQSYASFLEQSNEKQKYRQSLTHPTRPCGDHASIQDFPSCKGPIKACYSVLDEVIKETEEYKPVYFDEFLHVKEPFKDQFQRRNFLKGLSLTYPIDMLSYDPGAGLGKTVFIWRVPESRSSVEMISSGAKVFKSLEKRLPEYHTREMRKEFVRSYQSLVDVPQHVLRAIYSDLTLDATACQNPAIEARLRQALLTGDPDIAIDLRALNKGRPDDTFNVFFEQLEKEIASVTATDERRHDSVQHFSKYISVRDLINQTAKQCPEGTPIPSESTVLFAFVPKNAYKNSAKLYKGRINLQHKVQTRQLRASHIDEHYCAAIFSYVKRYAVLFKDNTSLLCLDDKSKVDFGEPGLAISTGVRGKKSLVPCSSVLGALDHDVGSKGSLTPSVCLQVDIPNDVKESFYRGQVHVTLKDSVFQPSLPFRHATELQKILKPSDEVSPNPYLLLFTDGGPDHRTT